jgi:biofilm PGA synthesis N-glycosyltransferase PgaC
MATAAAFVFWTALLFIAYTYVGYPALLALRRTLRPRRARRGTITPPLTLIIAAHNEAPRIEEKIQNALALDYPRDRLQMLIALDGCTDATEQVVRRHAGEGIELVCVAEHRGKAAALNAALERAHGEVIVFADVRQHIEAHALRALAAPFADPEVGVVSGELVLTDETGAPSHDAVGLYWRYEKTIRSWESDVHSVVGATGALYAVRRRLVEPVPEGTILDDVYIPMTAVLRGARCVFTGEARVLDRTPCCSAVEYRRKVRTLAGNFQLLFLRPDLLHPGRNPIWLQFMSHKVARLVVPYALAALFLSNLFLTGAFYSTLLAAQGAFYLLASIGFVVEATAEAPGTTAVRAGSEAS